MRSRNSVDVEVEINKSIHRLNAANSVLAARMQDFSSKLMVAPAKEREEARWAVVAATEAILDAHEEQAWLVLELQGIDPMSRE